GRLLRPLPDRLRRAPLGNGRGGVSVSAAGSRPEAVVDADEARRTGVRRAERIARWTLPVAVLILAVLAWDRIVVWNQIPHYILPRPGLVLRTLIADWAILFDALLVTLQITLLALAVAVVGGVGLAVLFAQSRWV